MPSSNLQGMQTPCGWKVVEKITTQQTSGGNFCTRYIVEDGQGEVAFMKAMDLTRVMGGTLEEIQGLINQYLFERNILHYCKEEDMTKVVIPLGAGELKNEAFREPLNRVFYIIFEKADGDLRELYLKSKPSDWQSFFKAMHHVCIAVEQLHRAGIAHQDIKPSNVLHFPRDESKVGDLGRVTDIKGKSPFLKMYFPGDPRYAPLEVRYGVERRDFHDRYLTDVYAVGSLVYQAVMGVNITPALVEQSLQSMPSALQLTYKGSLPLHVASFSILMERFFDECCKLFGQRIANEVCLVVREMCHPDFEMRGAPKFTSRPAKLSARRYTSKMASIVRLFYVEGLSKNV